MDDKLYGIYRNGGSGQTLPVHYAERIAEFLNNKDKKDNYQVTDADENHAIVSGPFLSVFSRTHARVEREEDWDGSFTIVESFHPRLDGDKLERLCREAEKEFFEKRKAL